jgi:hypothetical protein
MRDRQLTKAVPEQDHHPLPKPASASQDQIQLHIKSLLRFLIHLFRTRSLDKVEAALIKTIIASTTTLIKQTRVTRTKGRRDIEAH